MADPHQHDVPPLRRLFRYARHERGRFWAAFGCSVLNKIFDLAPPVLIGTAVDIVVQREDSMLADLGVVDLGAQLWVLATATLVIWTLESAFEYVAKTLWRNLAQSMQHGLRLDAYRHLQALPMAYFERRRQGDLITVLNDDVNQLERFLDVGADDLIQTATSSVLIGVLFFALAPEIAWLAILPMPFVLWGSIAFQRRIAPRYAGVRERAAVVSSQLASNLAGVPTIKSYTAEDREAARIEALSSAYQEANRGAIRLSSAFSPMIRMIIVLGFTATLVLGGQETLDGDLEVGVYSVLVFMTQRLLWPLTRLGQTFDLYQRGMASARRVLDLLDTPTMERAGTVRLAPGEISGRIAFEDVSFAYPRYDDGDDAGVVPVGADAGRNVLEGVSLTVEPDRTLAFVGATGSGKSTVLKLLLRFYEPTSGRITLDGIPIDTLATEDLRAAIGYVSQDIFLFHGTVHDNIAYGRPDATREEVVEAARLAEADGFISEIPRGYDALVGEWGQRLSGGQRQRISLARAILKDPRILVLDEATSAVDNETEAAIQRSLGRVTRGRVTLVVAHRLSTIRHADEIIVLADGRVAERGTHEELLALSGAYAALWSVQTGEVEPALP